MGKLTSQSQEIILVEAEEIPHVRTVEEAIKPDIVVFDKYQKRLEELRKQYGNVKINGVEDKEGYESAKLAVRELRTTRTGSELDRKNAKKFYLECGRVIDDKAQMIEGWLLELETPIKTQIKDYDAEVDKIKAEKQQALISRSKERVAELTKLGVVFDGADYVLDDLSYSQDVIVSTPDDHFTNKIIPQFQEIYNAKQQISRAHREALELQEKQQREAREELERQQEKLRLKEKALLEQQAEFDRKENEEKERQRLSFKKESDDKMKTRINDLVNLGLKFDFSGGYYVNFDVFIHTLDITGKTDEEWTELIFKTGIHIDNFKKVESEKELARNQKEKQESIERALEEEKEKERLAEVKRQQELEESAESVRYAEVVKYHKSGPVFKFRSGRYIKKMQIIKDFIHDLD